MEWVETGVMVVAEGEQQEVKGRFKDGGETCCDAMHGGGGPAEGVRGGLQVCRGDRNFIIHKGAVCFGASNTNNTE